MMSSLNQIKLVDEVLYSFSSADNASHYPRKFNLASISQPNSIVGVWENNKPYAVVGFNGGTSLVTEQSQILIEENLYFLVGSAVCCLSFKSQQILWHQEVDFASCFGIYFLKNIKLLIVHGEVNISALSIQGKILWQVSGRDIFRGI